jgi:AraC-like DNA-binding protein
MHDTPPLRVGRRVRTVSNRIACAAWQVAQAAGISPDLFSARTGIAAQDLADAGGRIDGVRHRKLVELMVSVGPASEQLVDERCSLFPDFPVLGNLCLNARTLREAIKAFIAYRPIIGEFDFLFFNETAQSAQFEYVAEFAPDSSLQALANFRVLATLIRMYDGAHHTVFRVALSGNEPPRSRDGFSDFFGAAVQYRAQANRMQFPATALDRPFPQFNAALAPYLRQQAQQELLRVQQHSLFSASVAGLIREIIAQEPEDGCASAPLLAQICARLNMSRWTLRRQLQAEGVHFSELEARVRLGEACRLLTDTRLSVAQISERLGFSSQSAFTRFFRSRHASAPIAFRQASQRDRGLYGQHGLSSGNGHDEDEHHTTRSSGLTHPLRHSLITG